MLIELWAHKRRALRQLLADFKKFDRKVDGVIPASLNVETKSAKRRIIGTRAKENT